MRKKIKVLHMTPPIIKNVQENVQDYLQMFDVFCFPSRFEGLGIALLEAQASGLKCIASDSITKECKITDLISFLSLEERVWGEAIAQCSSEYIRENMSELIKSKGYDIKEEAKKLEALYLG